ncbi:TPA: helix-turn-helix domain-containing protein [Kluyvera ascorbata]|nr:helix-turn-helix domain-containing protein [Kluyvera ascorbata]HCL5619565.1 helix-turn-helix domain-containing protein [Kluyvera ascorbata]HED3201556.1 helix-turn-helix domain-containing protein [Kluyvera ascorbata]HED4085400.1 helix-turn-helix domain-containing protein [Kluyvera ascorbata]
MATNTTSTFFKSYHHVYKDTRLNMTDKAVYCALLSYQENAGSVFPSNAYLADMLGTSESSIKRSTQTLASLGLISKTRRFNKSNLVTVNKLDRSICAFQTGQNEPSGQVKMTSYKNSNKNKEKISYEESQNQVADAPITGMNSMVMEGIDNLSEKKHSLENNLKDELNKFDVGKATSHTVIKEPVTESFASGEAQESFAPTEEDDEPLDDDEYSSEQIHYF